MSDGSFLDVLRARHELEQQRYRTCGECGRRFDLFDDDDAADWAFGHDCEVRK